MKSYSAVTLCIQAGALAGSLAGAACAVMLSNTFNQCRHVFVGFVFDLPYSARPAQGAASRGSHRTVEFLFLLHRAVPEFWYTRTSHTLENRYEKHLDLVVVHPYGAGRGFGIIQTKSI